ncbi:uncharacterized protein LOC8273791 [Ricinus communis]|uniref:Avr9/Cf-9 rapidly elicited protein 146 n=1 Tax=Ricinus communis TaxID=3988 RepID=B9RQF7_RICCO|nr:uncharacterized protein LOC8273791 [Ricinus communis]EEF46396.1 conserved hypothetical protein [Ricinus communis]|eukprot:XP_002515976.1 uncharacterized protein LOC8273791 [Ricinus communis]
MQKHHKEILSLFVYMKSQKMEQSNLPVMAKRLWETVRVIFFMLRKGISTKRKLLVDLNMMLKRGNKIASKAIGNLMFHHHDNHCHHHSHDLSFSAPPHEYEFSCSNTPMYTLPFHANKRRHHHNNHHQYNNFFSCAFNAPPTLDDDVTTMNAVKLALEMLNNNNNETAVEAPSPMLPGFGRSPMVRQLRITDSPFPLRDDDYDNGIVDKKAEEFIEKFYKELRQQQKETIYDRR